MFVVKAALVTNHPELGIRVQPYTCGPTLDEVALQLSFGKAQPVKPREMRWITHGNLMFIYAEVQGYRSFHFNPCTGHELTFHGPTLVFFVPMSKQDRASQLSLAGSWAHIAGDFNPGDEQALQPLFSHGNGTIELPTTKDWLTAVGDPNRPSGARERAEPASEKFGEGDFLTEMFEGLSSVGLDVKLIQHGDEIVGLAATGSMNDIREREAMYERMLVEDPGFYADRAQADHCVKLGIIAEVDFDPIHYPSPASFVLAVMAGYARALHLNVAAGYVEPEYGEQYLKEMHTFIGIVEATFEREPAYLELESPLLAKMPDEEGGMGR